MIAYYKQMLAGYLPENYNARILEIGCGRGYCMLALREMGYGDVTGLEVDKGQYESCMQKGLNVHLVEQSIGFCLNNSSSFDLVIAFDVLEHIQPNQQLGQVKAIQESLKVGGKFLCTVPNANSTLASRWRYIDWTHWCSFTESSLDFLLFNGGFKTIVFKEHEFFKPGLPWRSYFSRYPLRKSFWTHTLRSIAFRFVRFNQRLKMFAELGWDEAKNIPLSLNLFAVAEK
jgi:SAM-dependent methyltransferase